MKIGILSDTHGTLPGQVFDIFRQVELIIHAGDIGNEEIYQDLQSLAPVEAIYGNMDTFPLVSRLRPSTTLSLSGYSVHVVHNPGSYKRYLYELFKRDLQVDLIIHGHTHRPTDETVNGVRFINPGSCSLPRANSRGTVAMLDLREKIEVEFVYL